MSFCAFFEFCEQCLESTDDLRRELNDCAFCLLDSNNLRGGVCLQQNDIKGCQQLGGTLLNNNPANCPVTRHSDSIDILLKCSGLLIMLTLKLTAILLQFIRRYNARTEHQHIS